MKVLLVEDEAQLAVGLANFLEDNGLQIQIEADGARALRELEQHHYSAVILDWLLPGIDGIEICKKLRARHDLTPILMLTAQSSVKHRVAGLETGADDYVTKPFYPEEILLRLNNLIRRCQQMPVTNYKALGYLFSPLERRVTCGETSIELSGKEADILLLLFENLGTAVARKTFLEQVWGYNFDPNTNIVEVYIKMLRNKLALISAIELIKTKRGAGYFIPAE